jgi:hypothetical protein
MLNLGFVSALLHPAVVRSATFSVPNGDLAAFKAAVVAANATAAPDTIMLAKKGTGIPEQTDQKAKSRSFLVN